MSIHAGWQGALAALGPTRASLLGFTAVTITMIASPLLAQTTTEQAGPPSSAHSAADVRSTADASLRLGDVYALLRDRNPKAAAARLLADAADDRIPAAKLPPDPQLQLGFMNYTVPGLRPMDPTGMTTLQVMQMVPTAGKLALSGRIATSQALAQRARAADVEWDLHSDAAMAFYDVYDAEQSVSVLRETRRLLQDIEQTAATMYEVGEGAQSDVLRAQVEIARMTEDITRMEAMRSAAAARLNALLDRDAAAGVPAVQLPRFPDSLPSLEAMTALAMDGRPMLRAGAADVSAADATERRAGRELIPDLIVGLQYGQRNGAMGTERMGSLMLGASLPIFAGRRQLKMRDEAAAMRAMAVADLQYMRADTRGRIGEQYAALERARNLIRLYTGTVLPQAEATVTSAMAAYRVGRVDFMTLLDDRMTVNTYRRQLIALQAEEGTAWAALEMLTGSQLLDPNSTELARASGGGQ